MWIGCQRRSHVASAAGLLGADPGQQGHDHVGAQPVLAACFLRARTGRESVTFPEQEPLKTGE